MTSIETTRLFLRPFAPADARAYAAIRYHPEVDTWLMPAPTEDPVETQRALIADYNRSFAEHGYGVFAVFERDSGALVGHCGLRWLEQLQATDMVWTMAPSVQGKGYAREAAHAGLRFGFMSTGLSRIGALIRPDNVRSQAVAKGLGMQLRQVLERRPGIFRGWWDIDRATWASRTK